MAQDDLIPFDQREGFIWYNGKFVPWKDAKIHILTHGLHYASCVFEGVRAYNGKIFKNTEHNIRFKKSAELMGFEIPYSVEQLDKVCYEVLEKQSLTDAYLRPVAWRGTEQLQISARKTSVHTAIACWQWPSYYSTESRKAGLRLKLANWRKPDPKTAPTASKASCLYAISTLSKHQVEDEGYNDAFMLDYRGYIAESTGANIFFIIGDELHTPIPDCFLNGLTRQTVIELARNAGIKVVERHMMPEEMEKASDCFFTGTAAEITRVASVTMSEDKVYNFSIHPITEKLQGLYEKATRG